jgi:hypothetical protein|tara:strand:- start:203 stop:748 length:546 start_codon:yes stop_codon:yes gene_type:complete
MFAPHDYYDWNALINSTAREQLVLDIDKIVANGDYWDNSPPFQTNINIFAEPTQHWINLKMSFIWSCFAYMQREVQIKGVKSWGYKTSLNTKEDRDSYWHQHLRPNSTVLSGVYYLQLPDDAVNLRTAGTEVAPNGPEGDGKYFAGWDTGHWMIMPGKTWHRPGVLQSHNNRYVVAADMEF